MRLLHPNAGLTEHPEHAVLIAQIVTQWNNIEDAYTRLFSYFIGINFFAASKILAVLIGSRARLDLFAAAGRNFLKDDPGLPTFEQVLTALYGRLTERNKYAHAIYGVAEDGALVIVNRKADLREDRVLEIVELDELRRAWGDSARTFNNVIKFTVILHSRLPDEYLKPLHQVWALQDGAVRNGVDPKRPTEPPEMEQVRAPDE